ncbi:MAG TPA: efflux RND transporter periplasmic adaptor subunit, partial [Armatimonadota bacterium]|nr:efflux RND transporter periplasmic adaptor subunit [Armatimonadota bacterium]
RRARKRLRRRIIWGVIVLALLGGSYYFYHAHAAAADKGPELQTATAFRTTLIETVSATGSVTSQTGTQVKIGSQITGVIKDLYADVGSHVTKGQTIAVLDLPDLKAQVKESKAQLAQAITKLQQQESGVSMQRTQTSDTVRVAEAALRSAEAKYQSAVANSSMVPHQTSSDIARSAAALNTAIAQSAQAKADYNLEIASAQAAVNQAKASSVNAASNLKREKQLFNEGYIAASDLDTAQTADAVATAQLSSAQQSLALSKAKADADLATANEQVAQMKANLNAAKAETYNNTMRQQDVRDALSAVHQAQSQLSSAEAGTANDVLKNEDVQAAQQAVQQAEQQVKYEEAQWAKTIITTPISGTVLQMVAQRGETLAAGLSSPTVIVVADLNKLQVDAFVDETDIGKVKLGQSASVTVDAFPNQKFSGRVTKIASGSTLQQNVVTYDTTIAIKDPKHQLKPDMTTSVTISVGEHPDVVAIPNEGVKQDNSGTYAYVIPAGTKPASGQQATPERRPIKTGATDGTYTEIISGVNEGDTVVLAGWPPPGGITGFKMTPFGMRPQHGKPKAKK